ncbi:MAG TPA: amidohydrolase family protein [Burkholderiales bacterium]|nr:amidohydrolase family protein [Burkholderiales bacterium]
MPIVDAHQHFWDLGENRYPWLQEEPVAFRYGDYSALRRNYLPHDFLSDTRDFDVRKTVHVEAEWYPGDPVGETRWLMELRSRHGIPTAIVAQAWFEREDIADVLKEQSEFAPVRGIRHKPKKGQMKEARWRSGYALLERHGMHFELQTAFSELYDAASLATDFPRIPIVINHAGVPGNRRPETLKAWAAAMGAVAACPNVFVKVSGIGIAGQAWRVEDNAPVVQKLLSLFGPERCIFGSNYPVDSLVASYRTIVEGFRQIVPEKHHNAFFWENAHRVYRLGEP